MFKDLRVQVDAHGLHALAFAVLVGRPVLELELQRRLAVERHVFAVPWQWFHGNGTPCPCATRAPRHSSASCRPTPMASAGMCPPTTIIKNTDTLSFVLCPAYCTPAHLMTFQAHSDASGGLSSYPLVTTPLSTSGDTAHATKKMVR